MCETKFFHGSQRVGGFAALVAFGLAYSSPSRAFGPETANVHDVVVADDERLRPAETAAPPALDYWERAEAALGLGLVSAYAAQRLARRRREHRRATEADSAEAGRADDGAGAIRPGADKVVHLALVPRTLARSPFASAPAAHTLERQIESAAQACARLNRTIGLIYFDVPVYAQIEQRDGKKRAADAMSALAEALRHHLRATDHVAVLDESRIIVCVCLLAEPADLEGVAKRLAAVIGRHRQRSSGSDRVRSGLAVYPLHGRTGAELIDAARCAHEAAPREKDAPEPWAARQEAPPSSLRIRRRPSHRRRPRSKLELAAGQGGGDEPSP